MAKCIIATGLPGSGKTTYFKNDKYSKFAYCSSDMYIEQYAEKSNLTYNEAFGEYIKIADKLFWLDVKKYAEAGLDIIIDRTMLTKKSRKKVIDFVNSNARHYFFESIHFDVALSKWGKMLDRPGKSIPPHILMSMIKNFEMPSYDDEEFFSTKYELITAQET